MKKKIKKRIVITGGTGLLGKHFYNRFKTTYDIIKYPYRIENFSKFENWLINKSFDYFVHFAAITKNESKKYKKVLNLVNIKSPIRILNILNKKKVKDFKYFLFISSSHVYGFSRNKIKENKKRIPMNIYGESKKRVEDFIINKRKNFDFKIGIARIFNSTGPKQKKGNFVPDMINKMKNNSFINYINQYRDFIHIEDVSKSIGILIKKEFENPINISSGEKINLIQACKILNKYFVNKKIIFSSKRGEDIFGDNKRLKKIGMKKFRSSTKTLLSYHK